MKISNFFMSTLLCLFVLTSCSDDDNPEAVLEEELITNVSLTFVNLADNTDTVILSSIAPDGQDGDANQTVTGSFKTGASYALNLSLTNNTEMPADDVLNDDIIPEADEHFFTYKVNGINLTLTRDMDDIEGAGGSKIGINTTWTTGNASMGSVTITLVHEPETTDDTDEFGTVTAGSQDVNITFTGVEII